MLDQKARKARKKMWVQRGEDRLLRPIGKQAMAQAGAKSETFGQGPPVQEAGRGKSRWGTVILAILLLLLILLLLALFWPVKKELKKAVKPATARKGEGIVGNTRYKVKSVKKVIEIGGMHTVDWVLIVSFEVENLAENPRFLDYSHVKMSDSLNAEYAPSPGLTDKVYGLLKEKSPWESEMRQNKPKEVIGVFAISEDIREYTFAGRDLNWRTNKFIKLPVTVREEKPEEKK